VPASPTESRSSRKAVPACAAVPALHEHDQPTLSMRGAAHDAPSTSDLFLAEAPVPTIIVTYHETDEEGVVVEDPWGETETCVDTDVESAASHDVGLRLLSATGVVADDRSPSKIQPIDEASEEEDALAPLPNVEAKLGRPAPRVRGCEPLECHPMQRSSAPLVGRPVMRRGARVVGRPVGS
jgi:hypothetical protein